MDKIKETGDIKSFMLHRGDVIKLAEWARFDSGSLKISTKVNGKEISSDNVESFLKCTDLPAELSQLSIFSFEGSRSISMYFSQVGGWIEVEGDDSQKNWVMLMYQAIMGLLNGRVRRWGILRDVFTSKIFASLVIALPLVFIMRFVLISSIWYFGITMISWSYLLLTYIGWIFSPIRPNKIIVKYRQWYMQNVNLDTWGIIIAILSLIVAIIDTVVGLVR